MKIFDKVGLNALVAGAILAAGCSDLDRGDDPMVAKIDVGSVVSAEAVSTSFNETMKTRITCDGGSFIVVGMHSVFRGRAARVEQYASGGRYLFVEGEREGWRVY